ncbi:MAG: hypothetical protein KF764_05795 [Labilithrix sp.]|nr:hypothetical protein [Labilithrix sp.]MBX3222164.1 hypothetical protein [Labilithrix sp.]
MRRSVALVVSLGPVAVAAAVTGCTFLISFDEVPSDVPAPAEASVGEVDATPPEDVTDAGEEDVAPAFPPPCDPTFPLDAVDCTGVTRATCAKRASFSTYPAAGDRANDLVVCSGGRATCVQRCPSGCAEMPTGFPDQCDDCGGRNDGYYCGRDLRGWAPETFDLAVQCRDGGSVRGAICGANKCASACPRPDGPFPSCCVP